MPFHILKTIRLEDQKNHSELKENYPNVVKHSSTGFQFTVKLISSRLVLRTSPIYSYKRTRKKKDHFVNNIEAKVKFIKLYLPDG